MTQTDGSVSDLLPHRAPMVMIDALVDCDEQSATATKTFANGDYGLDGDSVLATASVTPGNGCCGVGSICTFSPLINPPGISVTPATLSISGGSLGALVNVLERRSRSRGRRL